MRKRGNLRVFDKVMNRILNLWSELRIEGETLLGKYGAPEKSPSNPYEIRDPIMIIFCAAGNEDNPMRTRESLYSALGKKGLSVSARSVEKSVKQRGTKVVSHKIHVYTRG